MFCDSFIHEALSAITYHYVNVEDDDGLMLT